MRHRQQQEAEGQSKLLKEKEMSQATEVSNSST